MSELAFFDTNVLLCLYDRRDEVKRHKAAETFGAALQSSALVISTQVVQEFHVSATRKLGLSHREAQSLVSDLCHLPLIAISASEILQAVQLEAHFRITFWDALILSAAETAGAEILYSENFFHSRKYGSVRVVNPFVNRP